MLVSGGDSVGMLNRVGCRRSVVKPDVSDSEVFSERASLHEMRQPHRPQTFLELAHGCPYSVCQQHLEHPMREFHGSPHFGQANRALCIKAATVSGPTGGDDASDELGDIL